MCPRTSLELDVDREFAQLIEGFARKMPWRVLVLENDQALMSDMAAIYVDAPVVMTTARTVAEADSALREEEFDEVIVDIDLGRNEETGEAWIYRNATYLENKQVVVLSGQLRRVTDLNRLRQLAAIVTKGEREEKQLLRQPPMSARERAVETFKQGARGFLERSKQASTPNAQQSGLDAAEAGAMQALNAAGSALDPIEQAMFAGFEEWIRGSSLGNSALFAYPDGDLSLQDLLVEAKKGTQRGRAILAAFSMDMVKRERAMRSKAGGQRVDLDGE